MDKMENEDIPIDSGWHSMNDRVCKILKSTCQELNNAGTNFTQLKGLWYLLSSKGWGVRKLLYFQANQIKLQ
jgi:hypothetical protein